MLHLFEHPWKKLRDVLKTADTAYIEKKCTQIIYKNETVYDCDTWRDTGGCLKVTRIAEHCILLVTKILRTKQLTHMKILLIEDEKELANSINDYLVKNKNYICDIAHTYDKASELSGLYDYDCLLVDIGLPDGSGFDIIKKVKAAGSKAGIIIISARDEVNNRIHGLNLGADDYLVKPFHFSELNARIYSLMRRLRFDGSSELQVNEITLDAQTRQVKIHGEPIEFTKSEYDLLYYLITNKNQVISKSSIAEHLVGEHVDMLMSLDFVYVHIKNLRKKLIQSGCRDYIKTVYGVGYKFLTE